MCPQLLSVFFDWDSLKFETAEKWIMGKPILVIKNGKVLNDNLKNLRMSIDQLESKLREKGISSLTIEISGQLGFELTDEAKPVTFRDLQTLAVKQQHQLFHTLSIRTRIFLKKSFNRMMRENTSEYDRKYKVTCHSAEFFTPLHVKSIQGMKILVHYLLFFLLLVK